MLYKKLRGDSCFDRYLFWMLTAIEILMSFTFLGIYISHRFLSRLHTFLAAGMECKGWFLFVDVDYFKDINDTLGHSTGDQVLCRIAQQLEQFQKVCSDTLADMTVSCSVGAY